MSLYQPKKYKKNGNLSLRWISYNAQNEYIKKINKIRADENKWYHDHGIHSSLFPMPWWQEDKFIEKQKLEKLSSKLTTCVYCGRLIGFQRRTYIRRWKECGRIGTVHGDRRLERLLSFDYFRICFGCANTEYAIGKATAACEEVLKKLKKEIYAQTY